MFYSVKINANWTVFAASALEAIESRHSGWWSSCLLIVLSLVIHFCSITIDAALLDDVGDEGGRLKKLTMFRCPKWVERKVFTWACCNTKLDVITLRCIFQAFQHKFIPT